LNLNGKDFSMMRKMPGPVRKEINQQLKRFENLSTDEKLIFLYKLQLEKENAEGLYWEEAEVGESSQEQIDAFLAEVLSERINELNFSNNEYLFLLKSTGIIDVLRQRFVTNSKVSKIIAILIKRSAKALEIELNSRTANIQYCLSKEDEQELVAILRSLEDVGMPAALIQHFINWNSDNKELDF